MPSGDTKFNQSWLDQSDDKGYTIGQWCKADKYEYSAFCTLCYKSFSVKTSGISQVKQHANGSDHNKRAKDRFSKAQPHFASSPSTSGNIALVPKSVNDQTLQAEIWWVLKVANNDFSFASCDDLDKLFKLMFPCPYTADFTLGSKKVSYLVTYGISAYFNEELIQDIIKSQTAFTIQYDETTQAQGKKQMDILIRYWSKNAEGINVRYLTSFMFGHAKAEQVSNRLFDYIKEKGLPLNRFMSLESDGPNVNKAIESKINTKLVESGHSSTVHIGTCNLHIIHNAFGKGIEEYGSECEELVIDVFFWFKDYSGRKEDFKELQENLGLEVHAFIKHIQVRWLTLLPAIGRVLEQLEALKKYFKDLPSVDKGAERRNRYIRIRRKIDDEKNMRIQMEFLLSIGEIFKKFETLFQSQGPLIHILYESLMDLVSTLMRRFLRADIVNNKTWAELSQIDLDASQSFLDTKEIEIGEKTRLELRKLKHDQRKLPLLQMKKFFCAVVKYLVKKLPMNVTLLKCLHVLNPKITRNPSTTADFRQIAASLPQGINIENVSQAVDEWKMYLLDDTAQVDLPIEKFWSHIFQLTDAQGNLKYANLANVVQSALALSHGNSDVERSLSLNKKLVTTERNRLGEETIVALRTIKDAVRHHGGPHQVPMTRKLMELAKTSRQSYSDHLDKQKEIEKQRVQQAEKEEKECQMLAARNKELEDEDVVLMEEEKKQEHALLLAEDLLKDSNKKLSTAIQDKNTVQLESARLMFDTALASLSSAREKLDDIRQRRAKHAKKRKNVFESLCKGKGKKSKPT